MNLKASILGLLKNDCHSVVNLAILAMTEKIKKVKWSDKIYFSGMSSTEQNAQ